MQEILHFSHAASENAWRSRPEVEEDLAQGTGQGASHDNDILQKGEAANEWRDRSMPAENWKHLRKKRKSDKEKRRNAWLYN